MDKRLKLLMIPVLLLLVAGIVAVSDGSDAADQVGTEFEDGDFLYQVTSSELDANPNEVCVMRYYGYAVEVVIPASVTYNMTAYSVTAIDSPFEENNHICTVKLPAGITSIGEDGDPHSAFSCCSQLSEILMDSPSSVYKASGGILYSVPSSSICYCPPKYTGAVQIPADVSLEFDSLFSKCTGVTAVSVDPGNASYSSDEQGALYNHAKTKLIFVPRDTTVYTAPATLTDIGTAAFSGCADLTAVNLQAAVHLSSIGLRAFEGCASMVLDVIPETVKSIQSEAFRGCRSLQNLTLPSGLTSVSSDAFSGSSAVLSITGNDLFRTLDNGCLVRMNGAEGVLFHCPVGITGSFTVPAFINNIQSSFFGCVGITDITIESELKYVGYSCFIGCDSLESINVVSETAVYRTFDGVLYKNEGSALSLAACPAARTGELVLEPGTVRLLESSLYGCSISSLSIPAALEFIQYDALTGCSDLISITVAEGNAAFSFADGLLMSADGTNIYRCLETVAGTVVLPDTVVTVSNNAFADCRLIEQVVLNDGLKNIGHNAFNGCDALWRVSVPGSLETNVLSVNHMPLVDSSATTMKRPVGGYSYVYNDYEYNNRFVLDAVRVTLETESGQTYKTEVPFDSLINDYTFSGMPGSQIEGFDSTFTVPQNDNVRAPGVFYVKFCDSSVGDSFDVDGFSFTVLTVPEGQTPGTVKMTGFPMNSRTVQIPASVGSYTVTQIEPRVFSSYAGLIGITVPETVTVIASETFKDAYDLETVSLPGTVTSIAVDAFTGCVALTSVSMGQGGVYSSVDGVLFTDEGRTLFYLPSGMTGTYLIPDGVTVIGENAFKDSALTSVSIPASVTAIGAGAFKGCSNLKSFNIPSAAETIGDAFDHDLMDGDTTTVLFNASGKQNGGPAGRSFVLNETQFDTAAVNVTVGVKGLIFSYSVPYGSPLSDVKADITPSAEEVSAVCNYWEKFRGFYVLDAGQIKWLIDSYRFTEPVALYGEIVGLDIGDVFTFGDFECTVLADGVTAVYKGTAATLEFPAEISPYKVISLGAGQSSTLTAVTIPMGVRSIEAGAFAGFELQSLNIPSSVTSIGTDAFKDAEIASLTVHPGAVFSSDGGALNVNVQHPGGEKIADLAGYVLSYNGTKKVYEAAMVFVKVVFEGHGDWQIVNYGKDMAEILPDAPESWKRAALYSDPDMTVTVPASGAVKVPATVYLKWRDSSLGEAFNIGNFHYTVIKNATADSAAEVSVYLRTKIADLTIPAEAGPYKVSTVESGAIDGMDVVNITISEGITVLEDEALAFCFELRTAVLPASLVSIGSGIFSEDKSLETITVAAGSTALKLIDGVLFSADGKRLIAYPAATPAVSYTVPAGTEIIDESVFIGVPNLKTVVISEGVTTVSAYAFYDVQLDELILPSTVKTVGQHAFRGMIAKKLVILPGASVAAGFNAEFKDSSGAEISDIAGYVYTRSSEADPYLAESVFVKLVDGTESETIKIGYGTAAGNIEIEGEHPYDLALLYSDEALENAVPADTVLKAPVTMYVGWDFRSYTVSYDTAGGNSIPDSSVKYGTALVLPDPVRNGYAFAGWKCADGAVPATMPANDLTVTATWNTKVTADSISTSGEVIDISSGTDVLVIDPSAVEKIAGAGKDVVIRLPSGVSVRMPAAALEKLSENGTGTAKTVQMSVDLASSIPPEVLSKVSEKDRALITGSSLMITVNLDIEGSSSDLGDVKVTVPYVLKSGEDPNRIKAMYIADDGTLTKMDADYDSESKTASFITDHFSAFAIVFDASSGSEPSGGSNIGIIAAAVVGMLAVVGALAYFFVIKKKE